MFECCVVIVFEYQVHVVYSNKNEGVDLYIKHSELYTEIHGSVAVNTCQIEVARKNMILLSEVALILDKAGLHPGVQGIYIKFTLSAVTFSIDDFKAKC